MKTLVCMLACLLVFTTGCSMCCGPFDYDYPTFGGKQVRADRSYGRVGSVLSDPMRTLTGPSADSNLTSPAEPDSVNLEDDDTIDLENESKLRELEGIEPLKNGDSIESPSEDSTGDGDSTASSRWRPRPLRSRVR